MRRAADRAALDALRASTRVWRVHDMLARQARDLARARAPRAGADVVARAAARFLSDDGLGRWVFYPWSGRLVHLLAPDAFRELRLNRNLYKITPEEQARLGQLTVGVVGLSAGHAVAVTLALEGACGHLKLADFDQLELSNMNRVRAGVHDIGLPKTVILARHIMEIDPYLRLTLYPQGVTRAGVDDFLGGDAPVDVLVDECDDLSIKIRLRERARELGLPVVMETSDRGLLDVERFDLEPARAMFHGRLGSLSGLAVEQMSAPERLDLAAAIVGPEHVSARLAASLMEIDETLVTWPQLASEVTLGGASVTAAVRRIGLAQPLSSGRRYVDLDALLARAPAPSQPVATVPPAVPAISDMPGDPDISDISDASTISAVPAIASARSPAPRYAAEPGTPAPGDGCSELIHYLVEHAAMAPSGGNVQPWRVHAQGARLWMLIDRDRARNLFSVADRPVRLALGAATENLCIAAADRGYAADVVHGAGALGLPESIERSLIPDLVAELRLRPVRPQERRSVAELAALIEPVRQRVTNREPGSGTPLMAREIERLEQAAASRGAILELVHGARALDAAATLVAETERIRFLCAPLHREMFGELRWTPAQAHGRRDGIDVATLGMGADRISGLRLAARPDVAAFLRRRDGGAALRRGSSRTQVLSASAVGVLSMAGDGAEDWLIAGRAMQRLWLEATALGLAFQPVGTLIYMLHLLDVPAGAPGTAGAVFWERERRVLMAQKQRMDVLFPGSSRRVPVMMFRLARAPRPAVRALRRPVADILHAGRPVRRSIARCPSHDDLRCLARD